MKWSLIKEWNQIISCQIDMLLNENAMLRRGGIEENQIGGLTEVYFGIFTDPEEGLRPRKRAYAIQEMTGSKTDLAEMCRSFSRLRI